MIHYILTFIGGDVRRCRLEGDLLVCTGNSAMAWKADDPRIEKMKRV